MNLDEREGRVTCDGSSLSSAYSCCLRRAGRRLPVTLEAFTAAACVGDGHEIVYVGPRPDPGGVSRAVRQSLVTGAVSSLHHSARVGVRRSPDGSMIVFTARANNEGRVTVVPTGGGKAVTLGVSTNSEDEIAWLPDGRGLLVVRPSDSKASNAPSLEPIFLRIPLQGGAPTELSRMHLPIRPPRLAHETSA